MLAAWHAGRPKPDPAVNGQRRTQLISAAVGRGSGGCTHFFFALLCALRVALFVALRFCFPVCFDVCVNCVLPFELMFALLFALL